MLSPDRAISRRRRSSSGDQEASDNARLFSILNKLMRGVIASLKRHYFGGCRSP